MWIPTRRPGKSDIQLQSAIRCHRWRMARTGPDAFESLVPGMRRWDLVVAVVVVVVVVLVAVAVGRTGAVVAKPHNRNVISISKCCR